MSSIAIKENRLDDADEFLKIALQTCRDDRNVPPNIYCNVLNNTGELHFLRGENEQALKFYTEAYEMAQVKIPHLKKSVEIYGKNVENAMTKVGK